MKFKILPKVDGFRLKGVMYKPGDVVDLPESYAGESWLQRVEPEAAVAFSTELESAVKVEEETAPFENPVRKHRKKSKPQLKHDAREEKRV